MKDKTEREIYRRVKEICTELPKAIEAEAEGFHRPTFRVNNKAFVWYMDNHHDDGRLALWCKSTLDLQQSLLERDPEIFFMPPYVGSKGWLGIRLDQEKTDWEEISDIIEQGYRLQAPRRLIAELDRE